MQVWLVPTKIHKDAKCRRPTIHKKKVVVVKLWLLIAWDYVVPCRRFDGVALPTRRPWHERGRKSFHD